MENARIFLVEDDDDLRSDLERTLQFCGYTVFCFANPEKFLSEFKPLVPATLITDMRMPKLSGVELQSELLEKGHKIPIIFISGESADEQIIKAFKKPEGTTETANKHGKTTSPPPKIIKFPPGLTLSNLSLKNLNSFGIINPKITFFSIISFAIKTMCFVL